MTRGDLPGTWRTRCALTLGTVAACSGGPVESNARSHDATLSAMTSGVVTFVPAFSSTTYAYTATVSTITSSVAITPTATNEGATITVNGSPVQSGHESAPQPLAVGDNTITVLAAAADGVNTKTYVIAIHRMNPFGGVRGPQP